jgi:hypothetical protein
VPAGPDPVRECRHSSAVSTYDHDRNRGDLGGHLPRRPVLGAAASTLKRSNRARGRAALPTQPKCRGAVVIGAAAVATGNC